MVQKTHKSIFNDHAVLHRQFSMREFRISVCMAAYNGAQYIAEQIGSILPQLSPADELIIVDDASRDSTVRIIESFGDSRIRLLRNERNVGVVKTFQRAISEARGDVIFLADQDDVWHPRKVETILRKYAEEPDATLVLSDGELIDSAGREMLQPLYSDLTFMPGVLPNLVRNRYQGSAMSFRREIAQAALPFPEGIPMHDSWIGLVNAVAGHAVFLREPLLYYRRHEGNVTTGRHGSIASMLVQRMVLAKHLFSRAGALLRLRRKLRASTPPCIHPQSTTLTE